MIDWNKKVLPSLWFRKWVDKQEEMETLDYTGQELSALLIAWKAYKKGKRNMKKQLQVEVEK